VRALVTGGNGFVGSAVVRALLGAGYDVVCLVRPTSNLRNLDGLEVALAVGDLTDEASLDSAMAGCDELYHVAAHYGTRPDDAQTMHRVNVDGTRNVLNAARKAGVSRIVQTSTIGTVGRAENGLPTESDWLEDGPGISAYARTKLIGEKLALQAAADGLPVVVVNPCAPVGARDIGPSSTGKRLIDYVQGRVPSFAAGGINFCAVEDVAQGHLLAAQRGRIGQRYILGNSDGNLLLSDFYSLMHQATGLRPPGERQPAMLRLAKSAARKLLRRGGRGGPPAQSGFQPAALTADPALAITELGLPQTPLEQAFREAVDWFKRSGYL